MTYNVSSGTLSLYSTPQVGMGVRAPPEVTSLVTPFQALAVLDIMNVPETELFEVHDDMHR